ncbi:uncharacterized protein LOC129259229 [Lytechinus pictus]|uniref:uncharacterized protein LOC129259229 n=1 Tax=Lytechinus pictus TaxID=7653 RepID=UPI0030B9BD59
MPVSLSVWRVRIGTYLGRYRHDPKKETEQSNENDNANSNNPSCNGSSKGENSQNVNKSSQQTPSSDVVDLKRSQTESPTTNIDNRKVDVYGQTLSTSAIPGCAAVNGSSCDIKCPDKESNPVPDPSDAKPTNPCDEDELDMRYITTHHASPQISKPDQPDSLSDSTPQLHVATAITGDQDDSKHDERETSNPLPSGTDDESPPSSMINLPGNAENISSCTRVADYHETPISPVSRHDRSPPSHGDAIKRSYSSPITNVLLLRSGDVESNPGPSTKILTEHELNLLADGMDPSDFRKVGLALGFTEAQLSRFERDNTSNIMGATYKMLCEWLKRVRDDEAREKLSNKLKDIKLVQLADSLLNGQVGDHIPSLTEEEFQNVIKAVKEYYLIHNCQIQADPLKSGVLFKFDEIFTHLMLMEENKRTTSKAPLLYDDLLKTKVNGVLPKRLLVEGEGGVGKTTLCAKIVWDWIHGAGYQEFKLVLLVLLRDVSDKTIGEIIKSYLPDDIEITAMRLNKHIFSHQKDVFLVLDGLDELAGDLNNPHQIALIILNRLFKSGRVLITSRGWKSDEIREISELRKLYAFIAVEGFSANNLSAYITKFFHPDTTSAEDLNRFISNNDVIRENMAPFPIYTVMLCIMWKDFDGERRRAMSKLQTFSQLFDEMIHFLVDHYLSKLDTSAIDVGGKMDRKRKDILRHLSDIGCIALQGLHDRKLVFTEQEFHSLPGSVDTGCQVGVLTKQTQSPSPRERRHHSHSAVSSVQFPHKLFQEYLAGMYLTSLHNSGRSEYDRLMKDIIEKASEFRELLYFTSAQKKEVGLDIVSHLIASSVTSTWQMGYGCINDDFIVDVAYESQDQTVAKAVADHLSTSSSKTLEIVEKIPAHTVAGHIFIMNHRKVACGKTASEDLADFMWSSSTLRSAWIAISAGGVEDMHENLSEVLADNATHLKIENLNIKYIDLSKRQSASRDLAQFICKMPHLRVLWLDDEYGNARPSLHEEFYSTLSYLASSAKIERLKIIRVDLSQRLSASHDLAQFICKMPNIRSLCLGGEYRTTSPSLNGEFYSTLSSLASSAKIERIEIEYIDLSQRPSASRDLAQFVCKMLNLRELRLGDEYGTTSPSLHEEFYSTLSSLAPSAKIERLDIKDIDLSQRLFASRDLAQFICKMPYLRGFCLGNENGITSPSLHEEFCSTLSSLAPSAKIERLDIICLYLCQRLSASRDLAQFICKMPNLRELHLGDESGSTSHSLHEEFYSTLSSLALSAKIEILHLSENLSQRPSASRDLAQFICKMNHLKNLILSGQYHDDFYSTSLSISSTAKIEIIYLRENLSQRSSASRDLAQFICKMNHLKNLILSGQYHDDFYSTSLSMASTAKIEILQLGENLSKRPSASRDLAHFVCKMNHLKNLTLSGQYHDDFYSTSSSMASTAKIEILHLSENLSQRPSASRDLAQFICKMNHLKNLTLSGQYHDDFYSTSSSMASTAKIEILHLSEDLSERPSASRDLAQFICKMNHLKNLTLYGQYHDDFYSTSSSMASIAKIEILLLSENFSQRPSASRDLAQFICKMNHLKNLTLFGQYHDDFYSTSLSMASTAKIEILHLSEDLSERPSASRDLDHFVCKMNHLKNLTLYGQYHDDFYSTSLSMASTAKIETLHLIEILSERPSASRDLAQFICKMNNLKNLTLDGWYHDDFYSTSLSMASTAKQIDTLVIYADPSERPSALRHLAQFLCRRCKMNQHHDDFYSSSSSMASTAKDECNTSSTVTDLTVLNRTLEVWQDCGSMFDSVMRITIQVSDRIRCDVIHRIHLPAATELAIQTHEYAGYPASLYGDPTSLLNALHKVSSQLAKVTFRDLNIGNDKTQRIIQAFRSTHDLKHLRILGFIRCGTDEILDRYIIDSDDEHKITVEIVHGKPVGE